MVNSATVRMDKAVKGRLAALRAARDASEASATEARCKCMITNYVSLAYPEL